MALTKISASVIAANAIVAAGVAENSISTSEIATDGVGTLQISDGAVTSGKLETNVDIAGTLDVTGVLTADSNVVIAGNLTVNGATVTNSSTNTTIADALIELGTGTTGSPANDAGIVIERGDSDNAFIGWDESADTFILGTGSFTGASTGNLTISTAPLSVGTLTASGITYPTSDGSSGQVLKTDGSGNLTFDAQTAVVDNFTATGDGSTTDFDTGINPGDEVNTWVFIDGVYQQKGEYSYSGSTISFSTAPDSGATIDVTTGTVGGFASADSVLGVYETTTTNTDTYTTGISASNENNTWVFVGGVYQPKDSYTFSSGTLTFDANTPTGQKLSVTATKSLSAGSVETNSITANAVTSAKIASNSILSRHIANNSIVGADISATTQITASTFTGALTGDVTGNVVGNLTGTIQTAAQTNITSVGTLSALTVSGQLTAGGLSYPTSDGTNEQVLRTDGSGNLSFGTVSGTTLNNNTNNYVMTGTGTANTLNGESGLIFDGTNLGVATNNPDQLLQVGSESYGANAIIKTQVDGSDVGNFDSGLHMRSHDDNFGGSIVLESRSGTNDIINFKYHNNSSAGVTAMAIDATNGKVGIGSTSPDELLTLRNADPTLLIQGNQVSGVHYSEIDFKNQAGSVLGKIGLSYYGGAAEFYRNVPTSWSHVWKVNNSERMRINSSGNVGINRTSPNGLLHMQSNSGTDSALYIQTSATSDDSIINFGDNGSSAIGKILYQHSSDSMQFNTQSSERMRITSTGSVGINETSPDFSGFGSNGGGLELDDVGSSFTAVRLSHGATGDFYMAANTGAAYLWGKANSPLIIGTNNAERIRIQDGTGRMGINTVGIAYSSSEKLSLYNDNFGFGIKAAYTGMGIWNTESSGGYIAFAYGSGGAAGGSISYSGGTTSYNTSSDYRLKENVNYTWDATTRLKQLKPARFNWISDDTDTLIDGFLAHEVSSIVPEAVTGEKDAVYTAEEAENSAGAEEGDIKVQVMDNSKLVPLLVKTIQELEERITALEG
jgi:hypothetical protein